MTRDTLTQRATELQQAIARGVAERQACLDQADKIAHATVRLEGRLAEVQEMLASLASDAAGAAGAPV